MSHMESNEYADTEHNQKSDNSACSRPNSHYPVYAFLTIWFLGAVWYVFGSVIAYSAMISLVQILNNVSRIMLR